MCPLGSQCEHTLLLPGLQGVLFARPLILRGTGTRRIGVSRKPRGGRKVFINPLRGWHWYFTRFLGQGNQPTNHPSQQQPNQPSPQRCWCPKESHRDARRSNPGKQNANVFHNCRFRKNRDGGLRTRSAPAPHHSRPHHFYLCRTDMPQIRVTAISDDPRLSLLQGTADRQDPQENPSPQSRNSQCHLETHTREAKRNCGWRYIRIWPGNL